MELLVGLSLLMMPFLLVLTIWMVWLMWHHEKCIKEGKPDHIALSFGKKDKK